MTDVKAPTNENSNGSTSTNNQPAVGMAGQYVKDLSFENPNAPISFNTSKEQPKIEISLNIEAKALKDSFYEVALKMSAHAKLEDKDLFIVELTYAGLFTLTNVPDDQKELILLIHCPTILFPYARRVVSDATRDGGFQPLMLEPIDFAQLYQQRKAQEAAN